MPRFTHAASLFSAVVLALLTACTPTPPDAVSDTEPDARRTIAVLATTDVHGRVLPWDYNRGRDEAGHSLLKVASLVESLRAKHPHTLLLDAGDFIQGNPFADHFATTAADTSAQHPVLRVFDAMRYDAAVLGNHEFNFGVDWLDAQIAQTRTPMLAGNVFHHGLPEPAYLPWILRDFDGVRVAVIGLTTPGSAVWDRPHVEGRLEFGDGVEAAQRLVPHVRMDGADVVIALLHSGLDGTTSYHAEGLGEENFGRRLAQTVPGIDVLVLGHTHRVVEGEFVQGPEGRQVAVIQPGRWASHLGVVILDLHRDPDGTWQVTAQPSQALPVTDAPLHQEFAALVAAEHDEVRAWVETPVATTQDPWDAAQARFQDTPLIDLIQRVQLDVTGAQLSATAAFNTDLRFGPGPITRAHLATLYPYENTLLVMELSGRQLRDYLEHSAGYFEGVAEGEPVIAAGRPGYNFDLVAGVDYVIDLSRPVGERIAELRWQGEPVRAGQRFTLALNSYRAEGGGGYAMLADAPVIARHPESIRAMIEAWLVQRGTVSYDDVFVPNWSLRLRSDE